MPRPRRIVVAGLPLHVVQRGNNKQKCFVCARDYEMYIWALESASERYDVQIHAYVLMSNHVHLLLTPTDNSGASKMMQQLGRKFVLYFNKAHDRTGTLWEGRFRSSLIETDKYLLACQRYIELNPVRAKMVSHPSAYRWSSYHANAMGKPSSLITPHAVWTDLGCDSGERCNRYRRMFADKVDAQVFNRAWQNNLPVGSAAWRSRLETELGVRFSFGARGRPSNSQKGL